MQKRLSVIFTVFFLIFLPFPGSAQIYRRDIIHLKSGRIIKGIILEMFPNGNIKVEIPHRRISMFKMDEVEWIEKETVRSARYRADSLKKDVAKPSGYFVIAKYGGKETPEESDLLDVSLSLVNGFHVNRYMSLGLGVEASSYSFGSYSNSTVTAYPMFADIRFYVPARIPIQPMFVLEPGYTFIVGMKPLYKGSGYSGDFIPTGGGFYISSGAGFRIICNKTFSFLFDFGVGLQKFRGHYYDEYYNSKIGIYQYPTTSQAVHTAAFFRGSIGLSISFGK